MFLGDQGSGAPHGTHICNGHAEFFFWVSWRRGFLFCRPPPPHFVCADMCNLKIPRRKPMIGAMSCSVLYVHLYFSIGYWKRGGGINTRQRL